MKPRINLRAADFDFKEFLLRLVIAMSQDEITHKDLAYYAGLDGSTIKRIMDWRTQFPRHETIAKIASSLRISVDFLDGQRRARTQREKEIETEVEDYKKQMAKIEKA